MRRNKNKPDKISSFTNSLQLPTGLLPGNSHMEINGNREAIIEGCRGVLTYEENIIKITTGKLIIIFLGRKLSLKCLTEDSLIVGGFITSMEFIT